MAKGIPYGISDFSRLIDQNYYYVDKTHFIPQIEEIANYLFLIRPRRFGKSVFLTMMRAYYDISQKDRFEERFGNLWIGKHPTPLQGIYQVLYFDFSKANLGRGSLEDNFNNYCCIQLNDFFSTYREYYQGEKELEQSSLLPKPLQSCIGWKPPPAAWDICSTSSLMNMTTLRMSS